MSPAALLMIYSVGVILSSLLGGWAPSVVRFTHTWMQVMISLVGGLMLGVSLLHLLPHGIVEIQQAGGDASAHAVDWAMGWALFGLLVMFFLIRTFHFHQHDTAECHSDPEEPNPEGPTNSEDDAKTSNHVLDDAHSHEHATHSESNACEDHPGHFASAHKLSWVGVALGLSLHTLIDGIALAAAVKVAADHGEGGGPWGLAVFLAVCLHKPLDAMSITSLMRAGGHSAAACLLVNFAFAMMCPAGVLFLYLGADSLLANAHVFVGCALGFSAGVFLCISLGDLLPELQFHSHDRLKLSAALLGGVLLAWGIGYLEPAHVHGHGSHAPAESESSHSGGANHSGHDPTGENHTGHGHAGHNHAGHNHAGHNQTGHGPSGHDRPEHGSDHAPHD